MNLKHAFLGLATAALLACIGPASATDIAPFGPCPAAAQLHDPGSGTETMALVDPGSGTITARLGNEVGIGPQLAAITGDDLQLAGDGGTVFRPGGTKIVYEGDGGITAEGNGGAKLAWTIDPGGTGGSPTPYPCGWGKQASDALCLEGSGKV